VLAELDRRRWGAWAIGVAAILAALSAAFYRHAAHPNPGSDFEVICTADRLMAAGGNPYETLQLPIDASGQRTPMTYPPIVARALQPLCGTATAEGVIAAGCALLLIVIGLCMPRRSWAIAAITTFTGFGVFPWLLVTGNVVALIEAFAGVVAVLGLLASRPAGFGAAIGAAGSLKLAPLVYMAAAAPRWPSATALRAAGAAALFFVAILLLDAAWNRHVSGWYWQAVHTGWDGHVWADLSFGSEHSPSLFSFLPIVTDHVGLGRTAGVFGAAAVVLGLAWRWLLRWREWHELEAARVWLALLALGVIVVSLPRFKPYTPAFLLASLAVVIERLQGRSRMAALAAACLAPNLALLMLTVVQNGPPVATPVLFALQYAQWILMAAAMLLVLSRRAVAECVAAPAHAPRYDVPQRS
jgi:hypothetical protein